MVFQLMLGFHLGLGNLMQCFCVYVRIHVCVYVCVHVCVCVLCTCNGASTDALHVNIQWLLLALVPMVTL